ncbi:hypothetical protein, partial [Bifidobacterium animalis]|uniref:hypothetical protein n=1 Tax=Bifidobacterium animalis TaxID=28025 RepID=UPI003189CE19
HAFSSHFNRNLCDLEFHVRVKDFIIKDIVKSCKILAIFYSMEESLLNIERHLGQGFSGLNVFVLFGFPLHFSLSTVT